MSRRVVDPAGREWRVWREWIELPVWRRWRRRRLGWDALDIVDPFLGLADGLGGLAMGLVLFVASIALIVLVGILVDVLGLVIPLVLAIAVADIELVRRLLRRKPFSVEAASPDAHVRFPVYGIRASRNAMRELEESIAAGVGPALRSRSAQGRANSSDRGDPDE